MIWRLLFGFVLLVSVGGCNSENMISIGAAENGGQIDLMVGQSFELILESNPTTGYSWEITELDGTILSDDGDVVFENTDPRDPPPPGSGGVEIFTFTAKSSGATTLTLVYHRPWEEDVDPLEVYSVEVVVR